MTAPDYTPDAVQKTLAHTGASIHAFEAIKRRTTTFLTIRIGRAPVLFSAENLKIHRRREGLKLIAQIAQSLTQKFFRHNSTLRGAVS